MLNFCPWAFLIKVKYMYAYKTVIGDFKYIYQKVNDIKVFKLILLIYKILYKYKSVSY